MNDESLRVGDVVAVTGLLIATGFVTRITATAVSVHFAYAGIPVTYAFSARTGKQYGGAARLVERDRRRATMACHDFAVARMHARNLTGSEQPQHLQKETVTAMANENRTTESLVKTASLLDAAQAAFDRSKSEDSARSAQRVTTAVDRWIARENQRKFFSRAMSLIEHEGAPSARALANVDHAAALFRAACADYDHARSALSLDEQRWAEAGIAMVIEATRG